MPNSDIPGPSTGAGASERGPVRSELASFAELAGLVGFAVVQPVLGPFGESPETFTAAGASSGDIVTFALLVAVVPLLGVCALALASRAFGPGVRAAAQTGLVGILGGLAASAFVRQTDAGALVRASIAIVVGVGLAALHRRVAPVRLFLRYTSPVPILLVLSFLLSSPVATLVRPSSNDVAVRAADGTSDDGPPPVLFVVLDELPTLSIVDGEGAIEDDLFPNLGRLADTATWYRDHTGVSSSTLTAVPALLTGRLTDDPASPPPAVHGSYPDNLLTLLARTHDLNVVEWVTNLCPSATCPDPTGDVEEVARRLGTTASTSDRSPLRTIARQARSLWWSQAWPTADDFDAGYALGDASEPDELSRRSLEFLAGMGPGESGRPTFDYLHSALPHQPWRLLPDGRTHDGPKDPFGSEFLRTWPEGEVGEQVALAARTSHLLQLQWADRMLGLAFDRMEELGRWDDALVIVTADHGVSFEPRTSTRDLAPENQEHIAWSPLLVKLPGQREARVVDDPVTALDVVPTVLDVLGLDVDWDLEGRSLLDEPLLSDRPRPIVVPPGHRFDEEQREGVALLDGDGLAAIQSAGRPADPDDPLAVWRHGRHGDLIGRSVDDLGVCPGTGPTAEWQPPAGWSALVDGTLADDAPVPLWVEGTVDAADSVELAASVDGVVVAWAVSSPIVDGAQFGLVDGNYLGMLLAEPLVRAPSGEPILHQIVEGDGCQLRPLDR